MVEPLSGARAVKLLADCAVDGTGKGAALWLFNLSAAIRRLPIQIAGL
jgi:hypothetical protein